MNLLRPRAGFTLVEVLVALAIFASATVALSLAYLNLLQLHASLRARDTATDDLRWARAALMAEADRALAERGGDVTLPDGRRAVWRATITPTNVSDLFDVTLEVEAPPPPVVASSTGAAAAPSTEPLRATQTLRLLRPTWSVEAERRLLRESARRRLESERLRMR